MDIPFFRMNAFAAGAFSGAPVVVCLPAAPLPRETALAIAGETGCSETTFLTRAADGWDVRWYTPTEELPLCTHAALAAGAVALEKLAATAVTLRAPAGPMLVIKSGDRTVLDLPRLMPTAAESKELALALRVPPREVLRAGKFIAVYADEDDVKALAPDLDRLGAIDAPGVIVTAPGREVDFVMRTFALRDKRAAVEDPVSASAHSRLVPYWSDRLKKTYLRAEVLSRRGAAMECTDTGDRVEVSGRVLPFAEGTIRL
jgi:PhzF family phenazine biosynthesis protein